MTTNLPTQTSLINIEALPKIQQYVKEELKPGSPAHIETLVFPVVGPEPGVIARI